METMWFATLRSRSLAIRSGLLIALVLIVLAVAAPVAVSLDGAAGLMAAIAAGGCCLLGALGALIVSHLLRGPQFVLHAFAMGMVFRMGLPLGAGMACHYRGGAMAEAGFLYYLLVFYPLTLAAETWLSLPQPSGPNDNSPRSDK